MTVLVTTDRTLTGRTAVLRGTSKHRLLGSMFQSKGDRVEHALHGDGDDTPVAVCSGDWGIRYLRLFGVVADCGH